VQVGTDCFDKEHNVKDITVEYLEVRKKGNLVYLPTQVLKMMKIKG